MTIATLAWLVILASAALIPISFITLLMIIAGSDGTASATASGFLSVVVAPPVTLVAGIGLLRRRAWARYYLIALFSVVLAYNTYAFLTADPDPSHYVSPSGVRTTVLGTDRKTFLPMIAVCLGALALLLRRRARLEFAGTSTVPSPTRAAGPATTPPNARTDTTDARGWRVGHIGRDRMYYEELRGGAWQRIEIDGEMLTGRAHHAGYLASPEQWMSYPEWARHRRDEIAARIRSELREPDYIYSVTGGVPTTRTIASAPSRSGSRSAVVMAVAILLGISAGTAWLAYDGVTSGETVLPSKLVSHRRAVLRSSEPVSFWLSIGLYSCISLGCAGLVGWGAAQSRRQP